MFTFTVDEARQADPAELAAVVLALTDVQVAALSAEQAEALVVATARIGNAAAGAQVVATRTIASRERDWQREANAGTPTPSGRPWFEDGDEWEFLADTLAPLLALTPRSCGWRVDLAHDLPTRFPRLLAALRRGDLDVATARAVIDETCGARADTAAELEDRLLPQLSGLTPGRARALAARTLAQLDPGAVRARIKAAREGRHVRVEPSSDPGMTSWSGQQPSGPSAEAWAAIDELARQYVQEDPQERRRSLDQARADAFLDLILGQAEVSTVLQVPIPTQPDRAGQPQQCLADPGAVGESAPMAPTARGVGDDAVGDPVGAQLPKIGLIPAEDLHELTRRVTNTSYLGLPQHPDTGALLDRAAVTYRPGAAMRTRVRARDGTCRFPGCGRPARGCDIDHVIPFPVGATVLTNLVCLCRHHHRAKHRTGWQLSMSPEGICVWTSHTGRRYTTHPLDHRAHALPRVA